MSAEEQLAWMSDEDFDAVADAPWSCTRDHVTAPCGDCDGCRYDQTAAEPETR
jgi:7-cyano-7-deazaguanine synthase in queuosine biosynthesis